MSPLELSRDAELAKAYWATREIKAFAVQLTGLDVKKMTYSHITYVRASSAERAVDWVKANRSLFAAPNRCSFRARLAGPIELGACTSAGERL